MEKTEIAERLKKSLDARQLLLCGNNLQLGDDVDKLVKFVIKYYMYSDPRF